MKAIPKATTNVGQSRLRRFFYLAVFAFSIVLVLLPFIFHLDGKPHADWEQFLGRFHPLVVHLPIGLILLVPLLEIMGHFRPPLREAASFVLAISPLACLAAVSLGFFLAYGEGASGSVLNRHMWGGISLTIGVFVCLILRPAWASGHAQGVFKSAYPTALGMVILLLSWAAHQGGSLTHGENYLTEYFPAPLKRIIHIGSPSPQASIDGKSFYARHIHPVLDAKCVSCHGEGDVKGGLRVDTYELLIKGGQEGAVIVIGQPEKSILLQRVLLPHDHKKFMPAEGRTPLTDEEILLFKTWIAQGASPTANSLTGFVEPTEDASPPQVGDYHKLLPAMSQTAASLGVTLTPVSRNMGDGLILNAVDASASFTDAKLSQLNQFAPYIVEVELGRTSVTDASFKTLAGFHHLRAIHLEGTAVRGDGLAMLDQLSELTYLNLSSTRVTSAAIAPLASLQTLHHLYLYNTPAQPITASLEKRSPG